MHPCTRRRVLGGLGGLLAVTAGCGEASSSADSATPTVEPTATATPAAERISLDPRDPEDIDDGARVAVHPPMLQRWLRETATSDGPLRVHATARIQSPSPPLLAFDRIRLAGAGDDANGPYALRASGGTRYRYLAGAEAVTPPANATVTSIEDLSSEQRRLVEAAVASDDRARFYPETERGEWARTAFFDGYVRVNDTVYRGYELQQTDAAFFSEGVWYVLDLEPVEEESGPILHAGAVDGGIREVIDALLGRREREKAVALDAEGLPGSVIRFVADHDFLLTHGALLAMRVERGG